MKRFNNNLEKSRNSFFIFPFLFFLLGREEKGKRKKKEKKSKRKEAEVNNFFFGKIHRPLFFFHLQKIIKKIPFINNIAPKILINILFFFFQSIARLGRH